MSEIQTPKFETSEESAQEAQDLLAEHAEWRDLLTASEDMVAKYQENNIRYERDAIEFIADVELKTQMQTQGETTPQKLISAQDLIRQSAYNVERRIAMARGIDYNPANPEN